MKVTSMGLQTIQKAAGERVTLGCSYSPGPFDVGELDIEWSLVSPDVTQKDQMVRKEAFTDCSINMVRHKQGLQYLLCYIRSLGKVKINLMVLCIMFLLYKMF